MKLAEHLEATVGEHFEPLFRFALSLTRAEPNARDLTQQAFYVLAAKGHQLRDLSKVKSWRFTTLHRAYLHMRQTQTLFVDRELQEVSEGLPVDSADRSSPLDNPPLLVALGQLEEMYQAPVARFYLEDYSYMKIAAVLEVPVGTVKSRISRGIRQLKKILLLDNLDTGCLRDKTIFTPDAAELAVRQEEVSLPPIQSGERLGAAEGQVSNGTLVPLALGNHLPW